MKKTYLLLLLIGGLSFQSYSQFGQPNENNSSSNNGVSSTWAPYCWPCKKRHYGNCAPPSNTPVPFDGGLSILLAAGAAYGIKRVVRKQPETK